jgi:hypothetical protein
VRLEPLYRLTFAYRERYGTGPERLLLAEGRCEGRLSGRFRAANRARLLPTGCWDPRLEGAVETDDGASVLLRLTGRGRPEEEPLGWVLAAVTHETEDPRYTWLNDTVGAVAGQVRPREEVVLDVAALVWEPLPESPRYDPGTA